MQKTSLTARIVITAAFATGVALVSACAVDPTAVASSNATGGIGSSCTCPDSSADCDGAQGQCNGSGLVCRKLDNGQQICTHDCGTGLLGCPTNYACKAVGILGGRLTCHPTPG